VNKFLYKSFHSWHHRLYVPYAFGSLYNHPVEGFLLDTTGAGLAEWITRMTTRQAMVLFLVSVCKTVDDHCGYSLPWDPLQMFFGNNADYHDIHHQVCVLSCCVWVPVLIECVCVVGYRDQIKFFTAIFCALGYYTGDKDDERGIAEEEETKCG